MLDIRSQPSAQRRSGLSLPLKATSQTTDDWGSWSGYTIRLPFQPTSLTIASRDAHSKRATLLDSALASVSALSLSLSLSLSRLPFSALGSGLSVSRAGRAAPACAGAQQGQMYFRAGAQLSNLGLGAHFRAKSTFVSTLFPHTAHNTLFISPCFAPLELSALKAP